MIRCAKCHTETRKMPVSAAGDLYTKLRNFLGVVTRWPLDRNLDNPHTEFPLHAWKDVNEFQLILEWNPKNPTRPTFKQFCRAYGLEIVQGA